MDAIWPFPSILAQGQNREDLYNHGISCKLTPFSTEWRAKTRSKEKHAISYALGHFSKPMVDMYLQNLGGHLLKFPIRSLQFGLLFCWRWREWHWHIWGHPQALHIKMFTAFWDVWIILPYLRVPKRYRAPMLTIPIKLSKWVFMWDRSESLTKNLNLSDSPGP